MKKLIAIFSIILFIIAITCVGVWFAPYILNINIIKQKIIAKVEHKLNAKIDIGYIKWIWLPFSHIELFNINYKQKDLNIKVPTLIIYPDISKILSGEITISQIVFERPNIEISNLSIKTKHSTSSSLKFPAKTISIKDATLIWHTNFHNIKKTFYFKNLNLKAELANEIDLLIDCIPPAAKHLSLTLKINIKKSIYKGNFNISDFKAHKILLPYISKQVLMPIKTILNINGIFSGHSMDFFNLKIKGNLPCLLLKKQNKYLNISCGQINLDIYKNKELLDIAINNINLTNPKLALSGDYKIYNLNSKSKLYFMNFIGKNIDLTNIRKQLIALWGKNNIIKIVCNIVRGGTASLAGFRFHGYLKDLKNINKLYITATIKNSKIFIPYGHLNLTNISGNLQIEDGILIAKNISAKLDDNYAKNGLLILGLHGKLNDLFHLQLDLNSNLSQLKNILPRVVPNKQFNQELSLFSNITGRAVGTLYLGESLKHIKYRVIIKKAKANFTYKRVYWPIKINNVYLFIDNYIVKWSHLNGFFGSEKILDSYGYVILKPIPWFDIQQLNAYIEASNALKYLHHYPNILSKVNQIVNYINGNIYIKDLYIKGPIYYPNKWSYNINIISNKCSFTSPKLPGSLSLNKCNIIVKNNKLDIIKLSGLDNKTPININGYLKWKTVKTNTKVTGSLNISGILNSAISNWLKRKNWIPNDYFPSFPLNIKKLHIYWDNKDNLNLNGTFIKIDTINKIIISLSLTSSKEAININKLKINNYKLKQSLSMSLTFNKNTRSIKLVWDGCLNKETLNDILLQNNLLNGQIKGSFSILYDNKSNYYKFLGILNASKLVWKWGVKKPIFFKYLVISGNKNTILINNLSVVFPDKNLLDLAGNISFLKNKIYIHLITSSNYLTSKTLKVLFDNSSNKNNNKWKISGDISFYINKYKYFSDKNKNSFMIFKDVTGKIYLLNSKLVKLYIEHTWLCNLAISGYIYPTYYCCKSKTCPLTIKNNKETGYLWIRTIKGQKNNFNDILTCLNIKQEMISGNLNINIKLLGNPECWHKGSIHIWSTKGRIYKFAALAKILSFINFTDLITEGIPKLNKKGFGYSKLDIKGNVINNKLMLQQAYIKGEGLNIFATGWIDIKTWEVKLTVLVSPFKTIDIILKYIPVVGEIIGGKNRTFITIPIGIKGPINDPQVKPLPISAIGKGLLGIVKRTLGLPIIVIKSIKDL